MVTLGKQIQLVDTCKHCTESKREWTTLKRLSLGLGSYAPVWEQDHVHNIYVPRSNRQTWVGAIRTLPLQYMYT
jgi:hypothetical protein